jgi:hypothetical protein
MIRQRKRPNAKEAKTLKVMSEFKRSSAASACPESTPVTKAKNMSLTGDFLSTATALNKNYRSWEANAAAFQQHFAEKAGLPTLAYGPE